MIIQVKDIIQIHDYIIKNIGGLQGIRDVDTLDGIVGGIYQSFYDVDLYDTDKYKLCRLFERLCTSQVFYDGNKRTAFISTEYYNRKYEVGLTMFRGDVYKLIMDVSNGKVTYQDLVVMNV